MSRQLDASIARARGYKVMEGSSKSIDWLMRKNGKGMKVPRYSSDYHAMQELDGEMKKRGWLLSIKRTVTGSVITCYMLPNGDEAREIGENEVYVRASAAHKALTGLLVSPTIE